MAKKLKDFEAAMGQLEEILDKLSGEDVPLEESIALYAKAAELLKDTHGILADAEVRVREIDKKLDTLRDDA